MGKRTVREHFSVTQFAAATRQTKDGVGWLNRRSGTETPRGSLWDTGPLQTLSLSEAFGFAGQLKDTFATEEVSSRRAAATETKEAVWQNRKFSFS